MIVGGIGAVVQFISLALLRKVMQYSFAYFVSAELAVASNFVLSNLWTFNDRPLSLAEIPKNFSRLMLRALDQWEFRQYSPRWAKFLLATQSPYLQFR